MYALALWLYGFMLLYLICCTSKVLGKTWFGAGRKMVRGIGKFPEKVP